MENNARENNDRELFDKIARQYANKDRTPSSAWAREYQLFFAMQPVMSRNKKFNTILDIGCGIGAPARYLSGKYENYIGIDHSDEMIAIAKKLYGSDKVEFYSASVKNINTLPIAWEKADLVLLVGVLHHLDNAEEFLTEIKKLINPGANFIALEPNNGNWPIQIMRLIRKKIDPSYSSDQQYFSRNDIISLLSRTGFREIKVRYQGYLSTPFAQIIIKPAFIGKLLSRTAVWLDKIFDRFLPAKLKFLSWNLAISARFPNE